MQPLYDEGQQEAGKELLRAANSMDPDRRALAWAMLMNDGASPEGFGKTPETYSHTILGGNYVDEIMCCL
jgi:hypothetical protein